MRQPTGQRAEILRKQTLDAYASIMHLQGRIDATRQISHSFNIRCTETNCTQALENLNKALTDVQQVLRDQEVMKKDALREIHKICCNAAGKLGLNYTRDPQSW